MSKFIDGSKSREDDKPKEKKINWVKVGIIGFLVFIAIIVLIVVFASAANKNETPTETDDKAVWREKYKEYLVSANTLRGSTRNKAALIDFDENGTPELVLSYNNQGDNEVLILYIKDDAVKKTRKYMEAELKLMYHVDGKKAVWYISEIDSGTNYYTDLKCLINGDSDCTNKKKTIEESYEDTLVDVAYKNISSGSIEDDLLSLSNSYNKDYYINSKLDEKMEKILKDRANRGDINEVYKAFILEKKYTSYTSDWSSSPNKYAFYDINGDGVQELLLVYLDNSNWYRYLIVTYSSSSQSVVKVGDAYTYDGIYFNKQNNDLYYLDSSTGTSIRTTAFYKMENNRLVFEMKLIKENANFYKITGTNTSRETIENKEYTKIHEGYEKISYLDLYAYK